MSPGSLSNLVLTGFMGTGKTAVGRAVAARLGRPFVDMDALIEERAGRTVAEIFAQEGEGHFRRREAEMCRELAAQRGLVIATGGWALGPAANRAAMAQSGLIVCLDASARELTRRLTGQTTRPLLSQADWPAHLERLLRGRQPTYRQIPLQVATDSLAIDGVAERVLRLWEGFRESGPPRAVPVAAPGGGYQTLIGAGLLDRLGDLVAALGPAPEAIPLVVVSDANVGPLYGARARAALGPHAHLVEMPAGETHKTLDTLRRLYEQLLAAGLDRSGTVVALGGGVVGDVAGFAAATFMRGVRLVQVPTTLLAMVDASVGGKTGVDLPQGKNLVGAFKQPALVVADPATLPTLPEIELGAGLAEVVKHGIIGDPGLFEALENGNSSPRRPPSADLIARAVTVKRDVVESDPFETGRRATLNLGHTFGHALEQCSAYRLRHGQAVAIGLVAAARTARRLELCEAELPARVTALLQKLGLPTRYRETSPDALWAAMGTDKKKRGRRLRFVLPEAIGRVRITDRVPRELVLEVLAELREDG